MKSGKKIYQGLQAQAWDQPATLATSLKKLGQGDLRSLIVHLSKEVADCAVREYVLASAMCEVVRRFLAKGKEIL